MWSTSSVRVPITGRVQRAAAKENCMKGKTCLMTIVLGGLAVGVAAAEGTTGLQYPDTKRIDHTDTYHGVKVADPYRWLEDDVRKSSRWQDWVTAQNKVTFGNLKAIPERDGIQRPSDRAVELRAILGPVQGRHAHFYTRNDGLQNQSVLYVQESLDSEARVLIDPNTWSKDGTVALAGTAVSDDGKYSPTASPRPAPTGRPGR
jgi:prolyl oligopeptidase